MLDEIFREYDIRGLFPSQLNERSVKAIGYLLGRTMMARGCQNVSVGVDARLSANELFGYLVSGLNHAGMGVFSLGLVPTPLGYFSLFAGAKFDANIMITGSHNPKNYNGFKITIFKESFFGTELRDFGREVQEFISRGELVPDNAKCEKYDILSIYLDYMCEQFSHLLGFEYEFGVDCANGASGVVIEALVKRLNLRAEILFAKPDGNFPNHAPDPTERENLRPLQDLLEKNPRLKMGFAFDGDADRMVALSRSHIFCGDELCYLFARNIPNPRILGEVKCSKNLFDEVAKFGEIFMGKTGHSNIKKAMRELNIDLAAEVSGHIFFRHRYFGYDDGIYAFLRALELLHKGFDLEKMIAKLPKLYTSDEIKIPVDESVKFQLVAAFKDALKRGELVLGEGNCGNSTAKNGDGICGENAAIASGYEICEIDGVRLNFTDGWALLRASNTSPYLITRFEATSQTRAKELQDAVLSLFEKIKANLKV